MLEPKERLLTFRAEGNNFRGSRYYSRKIHWPGNSPACGKNASGVTIGRGFDLGNRTKTEVFQYLIRAGVHSEQAGKIAEGAGLTHCRAAEFVKNNKESTGEITEIQQLRLFQIIWSEYFNNASDFYHRRKMPGSLPWDKLAPEIKEVFVDIFYQGRMTIDRVNFFTNNDKNAIIKLIRSNSLFTDDEVEGNE
ncbi:pesticin C-terminus-like muramidase [Erwinia mallotivora]|uniref:pesticin C-terminus-like muramidase n=1 Tax=Erwinia mallotivora TaxID=69222 RepID=UPI0021C21A53|nr:pesticin C-terminus-like muramidase [Erwinia mallotivora]